MRENSFIQFVGRDIGEQTSQLLGQLIVSKIQMAVMSRVDTPAAARRPFIYTSMSFKPSRESQKPPTKKYYPAPENITRIILAHQQTGQLSNSLMQEILGNVSTIIAFNVSSADATKLCKEFVDEIGAEAEHIPEDFLTLKVGEAWGKIGKTVFPFKTWLADQQP